MVLATAGLVISLVGLATTARRIYRAEPELIVQDPRLAGLEVPPFQMVDQDGRRVDEHIFDGRITILDFIFTHCPYACPMMTLSMQEAAKSLEGSPVHLVSVSVDPAHDTPERLRQYALDAQADLRRWSFLTGDLPTVHTIVFESLKFALEEDPTRKVTLPGGGEMPNITHPTKLIIIGPDRRVLGIYSSEDPADRAKLVREARAWSARARR
jgi:protein SCO1